MLCHDQSHVGTQSTGTGTRPSYFSTRRAQSRTLGAKRNRQHTNRQNYLGCGSCSDRCCSTCAVGQSQGTESCLNYCPQTQAVPSRSQTHCRSTESTLGEVAETKERLSRVACSSTTPDGAWLRQILAQRFTAFTHIVTPPWDQPSKRDELAGSSRRTPRPLAV
jgi:hypothetical protein